LLFIAIAISAACNCRCAILINSGYTAPCHKASLIIICCAQIHLLKCGAYPNSYFSVNQTVEHVV